MLWISGDEILTCSRYFPNICFPSFIKNRLIKARFLHSGLLHKKKTPVQVSPKNHISIPTAALSASGQWVETFCFLSACLTSSPVCLHSLPMNSSTIIWSHIPNVNCNSLIHLPPATTNSLHCMCFTHLQQPLLSAVHFLLY